MKELFGDNLEEGSLVTAPVQGICIGAHAIVGAASVVTKDVPDCAVVVGNPASIVKMLDAKKFQ